MAGELQVHDAALAQLFHDPDGPIGQDLRKRGLLVQQAAVLSVQQPGTGRRYGAHVASAPGHPPATDTGRLANDIRSELLLDSEGLVEVIGVTVDYGDDLELGTRDIEPRPFLRPALQAAEDVR